MRRRNVERSGACDGSRSGHGDVDACDSDSGGDGFGDGAAATAAKDGVDASEGGDGGDKGNGGDSGDSGDEDGQGRQGRQCGGGDGGDGVGNDMAAMGSASAFAVAAAQTAVMGASCKGPRARRGVVFRPRLLGYSRRVAMWAEIGRLLPDEGSLGAVPPHTEGRCATAVLWFGRRLGSGDIGDGRGGGSSATSGRKARRHP